MGPGERLPAPPGASVQPVPLLQRPTLIRALACRPPAGWTCTSRSGFIHTKLQRRQASSLSPRTSLTWGAFGCTADRYSGLNPALKCPLERGGVAAVAGRGPVSLVSGRGSSVTGFAERACCDRRGQVLGLLSTHDPSSSNCRQPGSGKPPPPNSHGESRPSVGPELGVGLDLGQGSLTPTLGQRLPD